MNSHRLVKLALITGALLMISGCSGSNPDSTSNPAKTGDSVSTQSVAMGEVSSSTKEKVALTTYENKDYGLSLQIPKGWSVEENGEFGIATFKNPIQDLVSGVPFSANMVVFAEDSKGAELSRYVDFERGNLVEDEPSYKVTNDVPLNGGKAHLFEGTLKYQNLDLQQKVFVSSKNDKFFIILATAPAELWNKYNGIFETTFSSF